MTIYIIRHGETSANTEQRFQGWIDNPLNPFGVKLAEITGEAMKGIKFDIAFTSPLMRAKQTADLILSHSGNGDTPVVCDERIKEIHMGDYEGKLISELKDSGIYQSFLYDPINAGEYPGGESIKQVMKRTQNFLKEIAQNGGYENVLVSTHGCALRCMLNFLYEDSTNFWQGRVPLNCSVSILKAENGKLSILEKDKVYYGSEYIVDRYALVKGN